MGQYFTYFGGSGLGVTSLWSFFSAVISGLLSKADEKIFGKNMARGELGKVARMSLLLVPEPHLYTHTLRIGMYEYIYIYINVNI